MLLSLVSDDEVFAIVWVVKFCKFHIVLDEEEDVIIWTAIPLSYDDADWV
jgi:hypothetical protein